jgi:hypothetical protein
MRFSASGIVNALAWVGIFTLIGVAIVIVDVFGFVGLILLGLMTAFTCVSAELGEDVPTAGVELFKSHMGGGTPEQRAAMLEEKRGFVAPLRFYKWCGMFLIIVGVAGFIWQQYLSVPDR